MFFATPEWGTALAKTGVHFFRGIVTSGEYALSKDALCWAAMTYAVAALSSLATLLYYAFFLLGRGRD